MGVTHSWLLTGPAPSCGRHLGSELVDGWSKIFLCVYFSHGWQGPNLPLLSKAHYQGAEVGVNGTWISACMACQHSRKQLNPLFHNAGLMKFIAFFFPVGTLVLSLWLSVYIHILPHSLFSKASKALRYRKWDTWLLSTSINLAYLPEHFPM